MPTATELLRQGKKNEIWSKYCGFLDLSIAEYMTIQNRLLLEQIDLISKIDVGRKFFRNRIPKSTAEFRQIVPITDYPDYEQFFDEKRLHSNYKDAFVWAHTSGRSGKMKWIPYTHQAFVRLGEHVLAGVILASAHKRGDVNIEEGDTLVYNTPPRPYISGVALRALAEQFNFRFIPPLELTEDMEFQERIEKGFQVGLQTGIDILGSMSVVLVKMGERFAEGAQSTKISAQMLHPRVAFRLIRGFIRSKLAHRSMLPKDLWTIKGLPCGGADTSIYREKISYYWGVEPFEQYGSTEDGSIATQSWTKKGMTFFPDGGFFEFIPEAEWAKWRRAPDYMPSTVLMDEVQPGMRYEVVITNFYGKPLLRYRTHDLIEFVSLEDSEAGIKLPQMVFAGRSVDFIDLAGFTGVIDEKMVWQAIVDTGIEYKDWSLRKETSEGEPILHLYIETCDHVDKETVRVKVHEQLKSSNPYYADYDTMIEKKALEVTLLNPGTFDAYQKAMHDAGVDLAHLKPAHMNASDEVIEKLLIYSRQIG
ncbi:MAG: GH3 auxin-responsive promoter family protein [Chloroflexi bacterium]|nr:GH3 auxin-responsive promoter family protein [Chloroflexota bacterium]